MLDRGKLPGHSLRTGPSRAFGFLALTPCHLAERLSAKKETEGMPIPRTSDFEIASCPPPSPLLGGPELRGGLPRLRGGGLRLPAGAFRDETRGAKIKGWAGGLSLLFPMDPSHNQGHWKGGPRSRCRGKTGSYTCLVVWACPSPAPPTGSPSGPTPSPIPCGWPRGAPAGPGGWRPLRPGGSGWRPPAAGIRGPAPTSRVAHFLVRNETWVGGKSVAIGGNVGLAVGVEIEIKIGVGARVRVWITSGSR